MFSQRREVFAKPAKFFSVIHNYFAHGNTEPAKEMVLIKARKTKRRVR